MTIEGYEILQAVKRQIEAERMLYQTRAKIWELIEQFSQQEINQERFDNFVSRLKNAVKE